MADQCSCSRVSWRLFVCCAVLWFLVLPQESGGKRLKGRDDVAQGWQDNIALLERIRRSPADDRNVEDNKVDKTLNAKLKKPCQKCKRVCKCDNGKPTLEKLNDKRCRRCCWRPVCRNVGLLLKAKEKRNTKDEGRNGHHPSQPHTTSHVYLRVVANHTRFREIHYGKLKLQTRIEFDNGDKLTAKGEMEIQGSRVAHGWIENSDNKTERPPGSPALRYDNIRVNMDGLYLVYAQVVFRYERSQHSSYILVKTGRNRERVVLAQCEGTSALLKGVPGYQSSCFTQTVAYLKTGSIIRIECEYMNHIKCPKIVMEPNKTFFGLVRISN